MFTGSVTTNYYYYKIMVLRKQIKNTIKIKMLKMMIKIINKATKATTKEM